MLEKGATGLSNYLDEDEKQYIETVPKVRAHHSSLEPPGHPPAAVLSMPKHLMGTVSSFNGERCLPVTGKDPLRGSHSPAPYLPTAPQFSQQMVTSNHR